MEELNDYLRENQINRKYPGYFDFYKDRNLYFTKKSYNDGQLFHMDNDDHILYVYIPASYLCKNVCDKEAYREDPYVLRYVLDMNKQPFYCRDTFLFKIRFKSYFTYVQSEKLN
jgi:hypothetical protein